MKKNNEKQVKTSLEKRYLELRSRSWCRHIFGGLFLFPGFPRKAFPRIPRNRFPGCYGGSGWQSSVSALSFGEVSAAKSQRAGFECARAQNGFGSSWGLVLLPGLVGGCPRVVSRQTGFNNETEKENRRKLMHL